MVRQIRYSDMKFRRIEFHIKPDCPFGIVLSNLEKIHLPGMEDVEGPIRFSVLELLNNSIRAQRANGCPIPIRLEFSLVQKTAHNGTTSIGLRIEIEDAGGGFDPSDLPYNLYGDMERVDLQDDSFLLYREIHGQQRFGMGLFVTRKTFDGFRLDFLDADRVAIPYEPERVRGTRIRLFHWGTHT